MEYLVENDVNQVQWNSVRRNRGVPSGVVVLHTAENIADFIDIDLGAETVARWIARRNPASEGYGSYHVLADSDSTVYLVPWSAEAFHDTRTNNHSVGISAAVRSADWKRLGTRGDRIVVRMAEAAAAYARWAKQIYGITIPARKITQAQAMARVPGFVAHGTMDPGRRSDPGADFNWDLFLSHYSKTLSGATLTPVDTKDEDEDMKGYAIRNHNGSIGLIGPDGTLTPISSAGIWASLLRAGFVDGFHQENDGTVWNALTAHTAQVRYAERLAAGDPLDEGKISQELAALLVPAVVDAVKAVPGAASLTAEEAEEVVENTIRRVLGGLANPEPV